MRELPVRGALPRARPLIPVFGPGVPPGDLLAETVPGCPITLRHLHGRPLVLGFARPRSVPCRAVLHELAAAYPRLARGGVTVLGILTGADADQAAAFGAGQGLPFPIVADPAADIARPCEIRLWPTTLWMDGSRQVRVRAGASSAAMAAWARERPTTASDAALSPQTG